MLARKIGVVSPELPSNAQLPASIASSSKIFWFLEMEAMFAYLFHDSLDEILIDANIAQDPHSAITKYCNLILQMRPQMSFTSFNPKADGQGQPLGGGQFFPRLEVLFQNGELISVFQPIVAPGESTARVYGYECLSRIRYDGAHFAPEFLFNYAQEKLALSTYDKICLMQALSLVPRHERMMVFVNIRPQTLISPNFFNWFKELLKKNHLNPERIVLEITEQYCVISEQEMADQCRELKNQGLKLAIDDFGSGLSNLSMMEIMKPDYIKISGRFIKGSHQNMTREKIIKNVLTLAADFAIKAVIENVEVREEWLLAAKLGAKLAQGFHFFKPMPKAELSALL